MHIICSLSSLSFTCEHFPGSLSQREFNHPVFSVPQKKLLSYVGSWASQDDKKFTQIDSYLLFLALLKSTDLVEFRSPAIRTEKTGAVIAQNMEALTKVVSRLNSMVSNEGMPHYVISRETQDLENVEFWIQNWADSYEDFRAGKLRDISGRDDWKKLLIRENALERLIKNPHRPISSYSQQLGDWASVAGSFPEFILQNPLPPFQKISCSDYWKILISKCSKSESLFSIPSTDLKELLDHCEENISCGSIFSNSLFKVLRYAMEKQKNFLGLGDMDIMKSQFTVLRAGDSVESANLQAAVDSAPLELPRREQYPNNFAFMKAKFRFDMAQRYGAQNSTKKDDDSESEEVPA